MLDEDEEVSLILVLTVAVLLTVVELLVSEGAEIGLEVEAVVG